MQARNKDNDSNDNKHTKTTTTTTTITTTTTTTTSTTDTDEEKNEKKDNQNDNIKLNTDSTTVTDSEEKNDNKNGKDEKMEEQPPAQLGRVTRGRKKKITGVSNKRKEIDSDPTTEQPSKQQKVVESDTVNVTSGSDNIPGPAVVDNVNVEIT